MSFYDFKGYLFDLDGCMYAGNRVLPGAVELLETLRQRRKKIVFMSNNSTQDAAVIVSRLNSLGILANMNEVIVPTDFISSFITENYGLVSIYPLAAEPILTLLIEAGHTLVDISDTRCDVVLVTRDVGFNYTKMEHATRFVQNGAHLVAANADESHPGEFGYCIPETGSLIASILAVSPTQVHVVGKPESYLFRKALERMSRKR